MSIAERVADITAGRALRHPTVGEKAHEWGTRAAQAAAELNPPIIDATMIYDTYVERDGVRPYEDHPCITPPWREAWVGYRNVHGNEVVSLVIAQDAADAPKVPEGRWGVHNEDCATLLHIVTWAGGKSGDGGIVPTFGPWLDTLIEINADGRPLDIQWHSIDGSSGDDQTPWPRLCVLGAYNLLNCRNVELADKPMDRPTRRRLARTVERGGQQRLVESVLHVRPLAGRKPRPGSSPALDAPSTRLHSVRGHVAHYGDCCPGAHHPRGLLFGRISGRVWVPQHARGAAELGATRQTFVLEPS